MTEPTRGARARRGNRRPGSLLLTALLLLAIVASSVLVFTDRVELLKLAVIIALWAAVVGAFVSFIYRRQADLDQAKSRDLKLVYDLQLDREISARREYELSVETHLRRELASELRAQSSDEVASLRAELAALRANLEILFDTDLQQRPAIGTERNTAHQFGDWGVGHPGGDVPERSDRGLGPGRVISSRIDTEAPPEEHDPNTEESPIIDVPVEPQPPEDEGAPPIPGGAHRRASEPEPRDAGWRPPPPPEALPQEAPPPEAPRQEAPRQEAPPQEVPPQEAPRQEVPPQQVPPQEVVPPQEAPRRGGRRRAPEPDQATEIRFPWVPPETMPAAPPRTPPRTAVPRSAPPRPAPPRMPPVSQPPPRQEPARAAAGSDWRPAPAEGQFIPAGTPGSNWANPIGERGTPAAEESGSVPATPPIPAMAPPPTEPARPGRHANADAILAEEARRARHSAQGDAEPGRRSAPPTLASPPPPPSLSPSPPSPPSSPQTSQPSEVPESPARHRGPDESEEPDGQHIGGQPVSELMARLQVGSTGGGRRRRRED